MPYTIIVPILTFLAVVGIGGSVIAALTARRQPLLKRLAGEDGEPAAREAWKGAGSVQALGKLGTSVSGKGPSKSLQNDLLQAGYHDPNAAAIYMGAKAVLLVLGLALGTIAVFPLEAQPTLKVLLAICAGFILSFLPNFVVKARKSRRRKEVRLHLPDAIDLLEICVSSGMGLDMAWNAVTDEVRNVSPILADEMALANLEIHLGSDRASALRHMADRTGAEEISSMVATLIQSERFGTSVADALRVFAQSMRIDRSQRAEESAEKMAVKLIFPMVLCLFPAMVIVCAGSAYLQLFKILGGN